MFKIKSSKTLTDNLSLSKDDIYVGIIKNNENKEIKRILYTERDGLATDIFDNSIKLPISNNEKNSIFVAKQLKVNKILEHLNYPEKLTKHQLNKIKKMLYNENSHIIDKLYNRVDSKNMDELNIAIFHAKCYRMMYKSLKH